MNSDRYNKLAVFFEAKFGERLQKICIDGGFSCPNRDGTCGVGGCIFCKQPSSINRPKIDGEQIRAVVQKTIEESDKDAKFIVYFQNYTNTYAPIDELRQKYEAALHDERVLGLAIATRPDCISDEVVDLLCELNSRCYVYVEMGLQTSSDATALAINRGYKTEVFEKACGLLASRGIDVVSHLIFGLPGEGDEDIARTIDFVNSQKISGVKIHSLFITKGTKLYQNYMQGLYTPQEFDDYVRRLVYAITHLREDIIIHRITGDAERGKLVAPMWNNRKKLIRNALEKTLQQNNLRQGCFFKKEME